MIFSPVHCVGVRLTTQNATVPGLVERSGCSCGNSGVFRESRFLRGCVEVGWMRFDRRTGLYRRGAKSDRVDTNAGFEFSGEPLHGSSQVMQPHSLKPHPNSIPMSSQGKRARARRRTTKLFRDPRRGRGSIRGYARRAKQGQSRTIGPLPSRVRARVRKRCILMACENTQR